MNYWKNVTLFDFIMLFTVAISLLIEQNLAKTFNRRWLCLYIIVFFRLFFANKKRPRSFVGAASIWGC